VTGPDSFILVVEDDPGVAELVAERIEGIGWACETVRTGAEARETMYLRRPELVVLDYSLPDMRADELIGIAGMPPFMITTGRGDEATAVRLMRAGARDYIIKDASFLDALPAIVARVLRELAMERSLAEARAAMEASLREKDALLREIHHRVKNNLQVILSLVRLQIPPDADGTLREMLADIQGRISAMSLIHEILYESEDLARVDFLEYLGALARNLETALGPKDRALRIEGRGEPIELPIDKAVPLGLLANELLTNAIKHAFPPDRRGEPRISTLAGLSPGGSPFIEIEDNGIGLSMSDAVPANGLGLQLVRILADQLGASLSRLPASREYLTPKCGAGTRWRIELPAEAEESP
jgi:two-component sensor histidine kinase/CheY-like chemotaxis protein